MEALRYSSVEWTIPGEHMRGLLFLITLVASPASIAEGNPPGEFNALFASTCMQHFYAQEKLREQMQGYGLEVLPPDQAEFFLAGTEGTAWILMAPTTRYVVSLSDRSICSVFAQRGDQDSIQSGFLSLVGTAPPLMAREVVASELGPRDPGTKTIARAWSRPTDKDELLFVLTTSMNPEATAQAMDTISRVKKER